jgi:acyl-CoA dehydrogenase
MMDRILLFSMLLDFSHPLLNSLPAWLWLCSALLTSFILCLTLPPLRRRLISTPLMRYIQSRHLLPKISETERAAIDAGTVWIEGEFFSGQPNWSRLLSTPYPTIAPDLQAFLDRPVEQVCQMATDWQIHQRQDLPLEVWQILKQERFFGLMIPPEYGGLGFSNLAYSTVMAKLASRSFIYTATVGVTNSLGPAKLLLHYGTPAQKDYYLPRLARGEEMPCFALTEPLAGSDAASISASGVVFRGEDGDLYLRLNFRKRYITLGAIATLIGLAFKLSDPHNLLGKGTELGITVALLPANTPGLILGQRHDPMGVPFYNSPIVGENVVLPVTNIIGGIEQVGQGWKMLMQSLAAGRGISFPASCTGVSQLVARVTGAHTQVRRQFGLPIGRFAGVQEPLARIGGFTYLMEAARVSTCAAVDGGEKPAVASAIAKYQFTELTRQLVNDGMDILGGSGICRGPRNLLANYYIAMPIPITVEGANILTRSLMIFGQGVIRCHPYLYAEVAALENQDEIAFDRYVWQHGWFFMQNTVRVMLLSLTRGRAAWVPSQVNVGAVPHLTDGLISGASVRSIRRYMQKLTWASALFALLTDVVLLRFGGSLKRQEHLTGRFADALSWMLLSTATLRRFVAEGCQPGDRPYVDWVVPYGLAQIQHAFEGIGQNLPLPSLLRWPLLWLLRLNPIAHPPDDAMGQSVARALQTPGQDRDRLTAHLYRPTDPSEALARLEFACQCQVEAEALLQQIKAASQAGQLPPGKPEQWVAAAIAAGIVPSNAAQILQQAEQSRVEAVQVDAFPTVADQSSTITHR